MHKQIPHPQHFYYAAIRAVLVSRSRFLSMAHGKWEPTTHSFLRTFTWLWVKYGFRFVRTRYRLFGWKPAFLERTCIYIYIYIYIHIRTFSPFFCVFFGLGTGNHRKYHHKQPRRWSCYQWSMGYVTKTHVLIHGSEMTIIDGEMMWNAGSLKKQSLKTKENTMFSPRELHVYGFDGLWVFRFTSQTSKTTKNNQFLGWWWCPLLGAHGSPTVAQLPLCVPPSIESATPTSCSQGWTLQLNTPRWKITIVLS